MPPKRFAMTFVKAGGSSFPAPSTHVSAPPAPAAAASPAAMPRPKQASSSSWFEEDDDEEDRDPALSATAAGGGGGDEEVDPLDAFMAHNSAKVEEQRATAGVDRAKAAFLDEAEPDAVDAYLEESRSRRDKQQEQAAAGKQRDGAGGGSDASDSDGDFGGAGLGDGEGGDGDARGRKKASFELLPLMDHASVAYEPFHKCFYEARGDVAAMGEDARRELAVELELDVAGEPRDALEGGAGAARMCLRLTCSSHRFCCVARASCVSLLAASRFVAAACAPPLGSGVPAPVRSFAQLSDCLGPGLLSAILKEGFEAPTPIQASERPCQSPWQDLTRVPLTHRPRPCPPCSRVAT